MSEVNDVFCKVDGLYPLKLKAQLKGSGLIFQKFMHVHDLVKDQKRLVIVINNKAFQFEDIKGIYRGIIDIIEYELHEIKKEVKHYENHKYHDLVVDEVSVDYALEGLAYREVKLLKIVTQINKYMTKWNETNMKD